MRHSKERVKAELMAEANAIIEECLDWTEETVAPSLTEIEEVVLRLRKRLGQRMAETILQEAEAAQPVEAPVCPQCGQKVRYVGQKQASVESRLGTVQVRRGYYHCARCRSGFFPPRQAVEAGGRSLE